LNKPKPKYKNREAEKPNATENLVTIYFAR